MTAFELAVASATTNRGKPDNTSLEHLWFGNILRFFGILIEFRWTCLSPLRRFIAKALTRRTPPCRRHRLDSRTMAYTCVRLEDVPPIWAEEAAFTDDSEAGSTGDHGVGLSSLTYATFRYIDSSCNFWYPCGTCEKVSAAVLVLASTNHCDLLGYSTEGAFA
jgi:hypothetical protein